MLLSTKVNFSQISAKQNNQAKADVLEVTQEGEKVKIKYNLTGEPNEKYDILLYVKRGNDRNWEGPLQYVSGDIGEQITTGENMTVIWDVLSEREKFQGDWVFGFEVNESKFDYFIDKRDGKTYKTVKIGNQTWMAENLAFKPETGNYWGYDNDNKNAAKYGYLYDWNTANKVCPTGWHLPSDIEWPVLTDYLGGVQVAGTKMKSTSGWQDGGNGTNESGFNAFPGGYRDGSGDFSYFGYYGFWWSSSEFYAGYVWFRRLDKDSGNVYRSANIFSTAGFSVRCIKD